MNTHPSPPSERISPLGKTLATLLGSCWLVILFCLALLFLAGVFLWEMLKWR